jgi:hypothetical protein
MLRNFSLTLIIALALCTEARAETFVIDYEGRTAVDPAEGFEADCLGTTEAADCAQRAALLTGELVEVLGTLEGYADAETTALFETAATLADPRLQALSVRYFANRAELPSDLWSQLKTFFFGPDASVGQPSAELLQRSLDEADQELARLYLEGRSGEGYGGSLPSASGADDPWAEACARDAQLDAVDAFAEDTRFTPATRLLMIDRFISSFTDVETQIPVTGFVTDESVAKVTAHFTALFGREPYPPVATSQTKLAELNMELVALQERLLAGDTTAGERLAEVVDEMQVHQTAAALAGALGLEQMGAADHVYWVDGVPEDVYTSPLPRAVAVGTDAQLARTAIRYINGQNGDAPAPGDGDGDGDGDGTDGGTGGGDGDGQPGEGDTGDDKGGGSGGCSVTRSQSCAALWLVPALAFLVRRRRRTA